jgi:putative aldouronate transport system permease protein
VVGRRKGMLEGTRRTKTDVLIDTINFILICLFTLIILYPLVFVLSASFSDARLIYQNPIVLWPKGFTLEGYKTVFENSDIWNGYKNTFVYTILGTFVNILMTVLGAYPLSRKDFYGRNLFTFFFVFTMFFNGGLIPTYLVIQSLGMINTVWVMVIPMAISVYNLIIMRTYFQTRIPEELQESAKIDGCSNIRLLIKIVLPLSTPIIAVMVLFYAVGHWNSYFHALIYLSDRTRYPLQLVLREILLRSEMESMLNIATDEAYAERMMSRESIKYAVVAVASIPMLILYPFLQKFFKEGIMVGALKG